MRRTVNQNNQVQYWPIEPYNNAHVLQGRSQQTCCRMETLERTPLMRIVASNTVRLTLGSGSKGNARGMSRNGRGAFIVKWNALIRRSHARSFKNQSRLDYHNRTARCIPLLVS